MRAEPGRPRRGTVSSMRFPGTGAMPNSRRIRSSRSGPMHGAFMMCWEMYGSGALMRRRNDSRLLRTRTRHALTPLRRAVRRIRPWLSVRRIRPWLSVVGLGTTTRGTRARRAAPLSSVNAATTPSGSDWPEVERSSRSRTGVSQPCERRFQRKEDLSDA